MGYLVSDHRSTADPTGTRDGVLLEWDTRSCPHCQAVLKVRILGPCRKVVDSPGECDHCRKPLCRTCAACLAATQVCPGEMRQNIDRAWQRMRAADSLWVAMRS